MRLAINGIVVRVGRFSRDGGASVAAARVAGGVHGECRYADGVLSLVLTGGNLIDRLRRDVTVQNVVLTVGSGDAAQCGSMAPVATNVTGIRSVPVTTSWAL